MSLRQVIFCVKRYEYLSIIYPTANPGIISLDAETFRLLHISCTCSADVAPSPGQAMQKSVAKCHLLLTCMPPLYPMS